MAAVSEETIFRELYKNSHSAPDWLKGQLYPEGNRTWFITVKSPVWITGWSWSDAVGH